MILKPDNMILRGGDCNSSGGGGEDCFARKFCFVGQPSVASCFTLVSNLICFNFHEQ